LAHGRRYRRSADLKLHQYSNPWNRHPRIWYDWSCSALGGRTYWLVRASISKVILDTFPHRSTGWLPIRNCNGNGVSLWRCGLRSLSEVCLDASMAMLLGGVFEHPENLEHESQRKTHCAAELRRILESRDCYGSSEVLYRKSLVNRICIWREEILHLERLKSPLEREQNKTDLGSLHWPLYNASCARIPTNFMCKETRSLMFW